MYASTLPRSNWLRRASVRLAWYRHMPASSYGSETSYQLWACCAESSPTWLCFCGHTVGLHVNKYRNGLLPMQYVFLIRSSASCKIYVITRRSRVTYFLQPARQRIKNTYCMGKRPCLFLLQIYMRFLTIFYTKNMRLLYCRLRQWASLSMGRVLKYSQTDGIESVWCISILSDFLSYYAWMLMSYWLLFTFLLNVRCHGNHL